MRRLGRPFTGWRECHPLPARCTAMVALVIGAGAIGLYGCRGPMAKIEALRDALDTDDREAVRKALDG